MSQSHSKKQINFCLGQESENQSVNLIDNMVSSIKRYSQQNGNLLQKYDQQFYLNYFDRITIQQASIKLGGPEQHKKQLKLEQFVRRFLGFIEHKNEETLFLAMSLRKLFVKIKEQTNNQIGLRFADFTNYLCDRIAKDDPDLVVPFKQVPQQKILPDVSRIRQIDINPPLVLKNDAQYDLPSIAKTKKKKDKKLAQRKPVSQFIYNFQTNQIITIGRLSSCIYFYDNQLKKQPTQITPKTYLDISRQIAILSMDFDEVNQRIGVIINGMGIVFWEASDNYETQKTITKYHGDKIFYLKLFKEWVTSDKNTLYFWNLNDETVSKKIVNDEAVMVNDVCQINHLRCICVSYTTLDGRKPLIVYKNSKPIARYDMGSTGCHCLHYNVASQMIIATGYHNTMEVFEVENNTFCINLKKQLKGHSSIVTCVSEIRNTNFILSGDDSGQIRIWQLNFMKCIQVVKVSKCINEVYCTGQKLIFSDSRLNVMQMDKFSLPQTNDEQIIYQFFQQQTSCQFAVTRKCFRKINFYTGRIEIVFVVCDQDEEISSAIKISSGIVFGTSKGNMKLYTTEGKEKWNVMSHEGEITAIQYDRKTRFIFCLGLDNKLTIWPEKSLLIDGPKKVITFKNKVFNIMSLLTQVRILFLASSQQNQISVWDYENLKLVTEIKLNSPLIFMEVNTLYRMLLVSTVNDELFFLKLLWKNGHLDYEMVYNGDSVFSALKKTKTVNYSVSINKQIDQVIQNVNQAFMANKKKKKSAKKLFSKVSITPQNDNDCSDQVFLTYTKLFLKEDKLLQKEKNLSRKQDKLSGKEDKQLKKSSIKINHPYSIIRQQQFQNNQTSIPSIKVIKEEPTNAVTHQTQQMLVTLKSLKKIDNQITTRIQIKNTQQSVFLVMGNSKGQITCFDIGLLIKQHFSDFQNQLNQAQSPKIYRPAKQDYDQELLKQNYSVISIQTIKKIPKTKKSYFRLVWKHACPNRQPISCLSFIDMKHIYLSASMTDGCCKYFDLSTGVIKGDLRMNLPLPIFWDVSIQKDQYIKKNIYETLIVLDSVISNYGSEMLSKEYQAINVTKFLESLKKKNPRSKPISKSTLPKPDPQPKVTLLNQEYSIEDVKKIIHGVTVSTNHENTLKSLEAHKRVKIIKQQMTLDQLNSDQRPESKTQVSMAPNQLLKQKEELQKLLAQNYFSVLGKHGVSTKHNKSVELRSIDERSTLLLEKINHNKRHINQKYVPNEPYTKRLKRQASLMPTLPAIQAPLAQSMIFRKEDSCNEGNLVEKLSHSLTLKPTIFKQKNCSELPRDLPTLSQINAVLKNHTTSISILNSNISKTPYSPTDEASMEKENKYKRKNFSSLDRNSIIEDKSAREILTQINQKLSRYKKSNFAKRDII